MSDPDPDFDPEKMRREDDAFAVASVASALLCLLGGCLLLLEGPPVAGFGLVVLLCGAGTLWSVRELADPRRHTAHWFWCFGPKPHQPLLLCAVVFAAFAIARTW